MYTGADHMSLPTESYVDQGVNLWGQLTTKLDFFSSRIPLKKNQQILRNPTGYCYAFIIH